MTESVKFRALIQTPWRINIPSRVFKAYPWLSEGEDVEVTVRKLDEDEIETGSSYPENWDEIRERILERDDYTCQECGIHQEDVDVQLVVHHKDGNKENCSPENLVTLCRSCHGKYGRRGL